MAEAVGLGASILAFVTITAQLSQAILTVWSTVKDTPKDIQRVAGGLQTLEFILNRIYDADLATPGNPKDKAATFWAGQSDQLKHDFAEYKTLANKLISLLRKEDGTISSARTKYHWFFERDEIRTLEKRLNRHIETFRTILVFLTFDVVRDSSFDLQELKHMAARSTNKLESLNPATRDDLVNEISAWKSEFTRSLQQAIPFEYQRSARTSANKTVESVVTTSSNTWRTYHLPVGTLRVMWGSKLLNWNKHGQPGNNSVAQEITSRITFDFTPELWLMNKALVGTFMLHHKKHSDIPSLTQTIWSSNLLPPDHAAFSAAKSGNISKLRELFNEGLARPTDRDVDGRTLLHLAASADHHDISNFLIQEGADCNAVDRYGRTALHEAFSLGPSSPEIKDKIHALLRLYRNSGYDSTAVDHQGRSHFSEGLLEALCELDLFPEAGNEDKTFHRVLNLLDFEEIDYFDPLPLSMALCTAYGGSPSSRKVVEGAIRGWLKTHGKGFYDLDDRESYRKVLLKVLEHKANELTPAQVDEVLAYACTTRSSSAREVIQILVRPNIAAGGRGCGEDRFGDSALVRAATIGNLEAVKLLMAAGANPSERDNEEAFSRAISEGHYHIAKILLDADYCTPEDFVLVVTEGLVEFVRIFLERGFDINQPIRLSGCSRTILFSAARKNNLEMVDFLVRNGADVLIQDFTGARASSVAVKTGWSSIAEYLFQEERASLNRRLDNGITAEPIKLITPTRIGKHTHRRSRAGILSILENPIDFYIPPLSRREKLHVEDLDLHPHYTIDSWSSLKPLTKEDILLIMGGVLVALWGFLYTVLIQVLGLLWRNRKQVTMGRIKVLFWGLCIFTSFIFLVGYILGRR